MVAKRTDNSRDYEQEVEALLEWIDGADRPDRQSDNLSMVQDVFGEQARPERVPKLDELFESFSIIPSRKQRRASQP
jgi:hypothetical protein